ncbi:MAG: TetR/AcrR family transcriptional regulator [Desulfuromonadales bacterium]|nr:TetR/AcrR family transcriptional regulator [Desulfuromonadales bacterium]
MQVNAYLHKVDTMNVTLREKQKRKPTDVRKREIIDVAINIIAFDGARAFTAKNIASAVGMTSGGVFRHFESMEAIVGDVIGRIEDILAADFPAEIGDPLERLKIFFLNRSRTILAHPSFSRLLLSDHLEQTAGAEAAKRLVKAKSRSIKFIHECLQEAEQKGFLGAAVETEAATSIIIGAIVMLSHNRQQVTSTTKSNKTSEAVWPMIAHMLSAPSGR